MHPKLQVANYGMGGHYDTHMDPNGFMEGETPKADMDGKKWSYYKATGDRIATFMVYLSEVKYGGRTVFPSLGLSSEPEKGSAVFWINLANTARRDRLTYHGGCPVLLGSKWITNKWILYFDQMMSDAYKCALKPGKYDIYTRWRKSQSI